MNINQFYQKNLKTIVLWGIIAIVCVPLFMHQIANAEDESYIPQTRPADLSQTWTEIDNQVYGAKPDDVGPIGGRENYKRIIATGDHTVSNAQELIDALKKAKAGETVFITGETEIDMSVRVRAEDFVLEIPAGVTLASDRGHNGSAGALIYSDEFKTRPLIQVMGENVRITGLRLRGPDPKLRMELHRRSFGEGGGGHEYYYKFPTSDGIVTDHSSLEVDNCELYGWSHAAVYLRKGGGHHIHHNFIHHNQRHGLGYGVSHNLAFSLIEYNLFDSNRHSIAGTGRSPSGYEARHNVVLEHANSHLFDMHGGRDRKDGTNIAGTWMKIYNNTFVATHVRAIVIRGVPEEETLIHHNWFYIPQPGKMVIVSDGKTQVRDNLYGRVPRKQEEDYDF